METRKDVLARAVFELSLAGLVGFSAWGAFHNVYAGILAGLVWIRQWGVEL